MMIQYTPANRSEPTRQQEGLDIYRLACELSKIIGSSPRLPAVVKTSGSRLPGGETRQTATDETSWRRGQLRN